MTKINGETYVLYVFNIELTILKLIYKSKVILAKPPRELFNRQAISS